MSAEAQRGGLLDQLSGDPPRHRSRQAARAREALLAYAFLAPALVVFAVFAFYPLGRLVQLSLHDQRGVLANARQEYVGFGQWSDVLGGEDFLGSLWVTVRYVAISVPLGLVLGVALAVAAHRKLAGIKAFQVIFSSTIATSVAVASVIFYALVNPEVGYFRNVSWLSWLDTENPRTALLSVALSSVWQNLGLTFVVVLAGLQAIPQELVEAARLDGFSATRRLFRITLPLVSPTLVFAAVVLVAFAFQAFGQVQILTGGGPSGTTDTLVHHIFDLQLTNPNRAATMALGLFGLTFAVTLGQFLLLDRRVHHGL